MAWTFTLSVVQICNHYAATTPTINKMMHHVWMIYGTELSRWKLNRPAIQQRRAWAAGGLWNYIEKTVLQLPVRPCDLRGSRVQCPWGIFNFREEAGLHAALCTFFPTSATGVPVSSDHNIKSHHRHWIREICHAKKMTSSLRRIHFSLSPGGKSKQSEATLLLGLCVSVSEMSKLQ